MLESKIIKGEKINCMQTLFGPFLVCTPACLPVSIPSYGRNIEHQPELGAIVSNVNWKKAKKEPKLLSCAKARSVNEKNKSVDHSSRVRFKPTVEVDGKD